MKTAGGRQITGVTFNPVQPLVALFRAGEIKVLALTGQAGAGKTTISQQWLELGKSLDIPMAILSLDAFFRLSRRGRAAWLEEGRQLGSEEYARRADQQAWWDFDRLKRVLAEFRRGQPINLRGVYNREDNGELTGQVHLDPVKNGLILILEGVAVAHVGADLVLYLHASADTRFARMLKRDTRNVPQARERFRLTQEFEQRYFNFAWSSIGMFVQNEGEGLVLMRDPTREMILSDGTVFMED